MDAIVQLPEELKALLAIGITLIVTQALKAASAKVGFDLSGHAAEVTAALVGAVLVLINGLLAQIPVEFASIAQSLLGLVVVVLGSYGAYKVLLKSPKG